MPPTPSTAKRLAQNPYAVAAAAAAAIPTLWLTYRLIRRLGGTRKVVVPSLDNCARWTNAEVIAFLEASHLSPQCIQAFRDNDIDGSVLLDLESDHLSEMGVKKLKDRILFQKCIDAIRPTVEASDDESVATAETTESEHDVSPTADESQRAITPAAVHRPATGDDRTKVIHAIVMKLQSIYERCASDAFLNAEPTLQMQVVRAAKAELNQILAVVKAFPAGEVQSVLPLTQQLTAMLDGVEQELQKAVSQPEAAVAVNVQAQEALAKLHAMLDGFLQALSSPDASQLAQGDRERLATNIASHVMKSLEVAAALPEGEQVTLKEKCQVVLRAAKRLATGASSQVPAPPAPVPVQQPASLQFLIRRIRAVFEALKSNALMESPVDERRIVINKLRGELQSIEQESQHLSQQEQSVLGQVFANVKQVLEQMTALTTQEANMATLKQEQQQEVQPAAPVRKTTNPIEAISSAIKEVLVVLKDPTFLQATPSEQAKQCTVLSKHLQRQRDFIATLPESIQAAVMPMLEKVEALVNQVHQQAAKAASVPAPSRQEPRDAEEARLESLAQNSSPEFGDVVARLKEVYDFVSSPKFDGAPPAIRAQQAKELLTFVQKVSKMSAALPPAEQQAVLELVAPLDQLLQHITGTADAATTNNAPSQAFQTIISSLQQVLGVVNSDQFQGAPSSAQQEIAAKLNKHVEAILPHLKELSPEERATALKFADPLHKLLTAAASGQVDDDEVDVEDVPAPTAKSASTSNAPSQAFQTIISSLQQVLGVVNSDQFQGAPSSAQQEIAAKLNKHVEAILPHLKELSPEERATALKFADPLHKLLKAAASGQVDDEGEDVPAPTAKSASTTGESSQAFQTIISSLQQVVGVINSDQFQGAPPAIKQEIAAKLSAHVEASVAHLSKLPEHERNVAYKFVEPLRRILSSVLDNAADDEAMEDANEEQADDDVESDTASPITSFSAYLTKLRAVMEVVQQDSFLKAPRELRTRMSGLILKEVQVLQSSLSKLTSEQRAAVQPVLEQLVAIVGQDVEQSADVAEEPSQPFSEDYNEDGEDVPERDVCLQRALEGIRLMRSRTVTMDELQSLLRLLDDIDGNGVTSEEEVKIRQVFHKELELAIRKVKQENGIVDDDEGEEDAQKDDEADDVAPTAVDAGDAQQVVEAFTSILRALRNAKVTSTTQLIPITNMIEETLQTADQSGIAWRSSAAAVDVIGQTLTLVQDIQNAIQSQPHSPSEIENILRTALDQIKSHPPTTTEELTHYIEILDEVQTLQDGLTREDLIAYQDLQMAVLARHKTLQQENVLNSPSATSCPPNTPAARHDTTSDQPPALVRDEDEDAAQDGAAVEDDIPEEEQIVARMLFQIIDKLQRQRFSNQELNAFEQILNRLRQQQLHAQVIQVLSVADELLGMHRSQNVADQLSTRNASSTEAPQTSAEAVTRNKSTSPEKSPQKSDVAADSANVEDEEGIPNGLSNELGLLPRILDRLVLADFVETTTLFEIKCISSILTQLSSFSDVRGNADLQQGVRRAKVLFSDHMQKYQGISKEGASVLVPTILTGQDVEDGSGAKVRQFTVAGGEEAEEYTINETFLAEALNESTATINAPVSDAKKAAWEGKSRAVILCVQQYPEGAENETALSELMMLHDALDRRHGFDIVSVVDDELSLDEARSIICEVAAEEPTRLLVYLHSPQPPCIAPTPNALTFQDSTALRYEEILKLSAGVPQVVVIHDIGRTLNVMSMSNGVASQTLSVALTEGAAQVANTSRCWLFDGVFTPLVVELLGRDESAVTIAPEDVIHFAVTAVTGRPIALGRSYTQDEALATGFWVTSEGLA